MHRIKMANIWLSHYYFPLYERNEENHQSWKSSCQPGCDFQKPMLPATTTNRSELVSKLKTDPDSGDMIDIFKFL